MVQATNLGYPRIGTKRELEKALEHFWLSQLSETALLEQAAALRRHHWFVQQQLGFNYIPSNDFSLYDHVLDTIAMVGAVPARYRWKGTHVDLQTYFAMARGVGQDRGRSSAVPPMEMTKWFDTNYHYIVPEFEEGQQFFLASTKPLDEFLEARALGIHSRPVLLGPVSFLLLGKPHHPSVRPLSLLERLLPVYEEVIRRLTEASADWIQMDEPCLALDLDAGAQTAFQTAYARLAKASLQARLLLATYFGDLRENLPLALRLPVAAVHLDLVRAPQQLEHALAAVPPSLSLSLGVVEGRNVWNTGLDRALALIEQGVQALGTEHILVGPSCSLLHVPVDLALETRLDEELRSWLAFANQKVEEIVLLTRAINEGPEAIAPALQENQQAQASRRSSPRIHREDVAQRVTSVEDEITQRHSPFVERRQKQRERLKLPVLPTTLIGSLPQTSEVRSVRAANKSGKMERASYEAFLRKEIEQAIRFQEEVGLDVLVHGEFERNDMVEHFGEQLEGIAVTQNGWVQSSGSLCVRPPILYGDIAREQPMTVG